MKVSWLGWSLLSLLAVPTLADSPESNSPTVNRLEKRRSRGIDPTEPSVFNGQDVPPLQQLTPESFEELTKDGIWLAHPSLCHNSLMNVPQI